MVDISKLPDYLRDDVLIAFDHGSRVYGTAGADSNYDIIVVVTDSHDFSVYPNNIMELQVDNFDYQIMNVSTYKELIYNHNIIAVESMFMSEDHYSDYYKFTRIFQKYFILDKWKMRQVISTIVGNSYAKCKKKLTVPDSFDQHRAQKSIFHCIRLLMFGIQLGTDGIISDYSCANKYWDEIKCMGIDWNEYKKKYKPIINELQTKMRIVCPEP